MQTTNAVSTTSIPMVPSRMAVPPPLRQDIRDADTVVGWIDGMAFGFLGFGHQDDAVNAAWVAYRTMSRRFAGATGDRRLPIDTEPMSLDGSGDVELILAGGRPVATLLRPGAASRSGPDSFGFELRLPVAADERTVRSTAQLVYRTMRRSGIRWAMWTAEPAERAAAAPRPTAALPAAAAAAPGTDSPGTDSRQRDVDAGPREPREPRAAAPVAIGTAAIVAAMLVAVALPALTLSSVVYVLGVGAALVALFALGSLVRVIATDVRDALRRRTGPGRPARPAAGPSGRAALATRIRGGAMSRARTPITPGNAVRQAS